MVRCGSDGSEVFEYILEKTPNLFPIFCLTRNYMCKTLLY